MVVLIYIDGGCGTAFDEMVSLMKMIPKHMWSKP